MRSHKFDRHFPRVTRHFTRDKLQWQQASIVFSSVFECFHHLIANVTESYNTTRCSISDVSFPRSTHVLYFGRF